MWRPVLWTVLAGLLLIVMTIPVVGITSYQTFVHVLQNISEVTGVANNLDLGSTVLRLGAGPLLATIVLYGGYILGIGAMLVSLRFDRETSYMVTTGATMLLAPLLWDHYLATLVLPAALLAQRGRTWGLALPLLAWLPPPFLPFLAVAGTVLPFAVARSRGPRQVSPAPTQDPMVPVPAPTGALETVHAAVATDGQAAAGSISASNPTGF
jgi:hypothetical protein